MDEKQSYQLSAKEVIRWALASWGLFVSVFLIIYLLRGRADEELYDPPVYTIVPTMTPYPTIQPTEAYELMQSFMLAPPKCDLPCWWGIEPGKSTLDKLHKSLSPFMPFQEQRDPSGQLKSLDIWNSSRRGGEPSVTFGLDGQTIESILVDGLGNAYAKGYDISTVLQTYGRPDQVCISLENSYSDRPLMLLSMTYARKGIEVSYSYFPDVECCVMHTNLNENSPVHFALWEPSNKSPVISCESRFWQGWRPFKPIYEVTDMSIDAFYKRFSQMKPGENWIEASTECWETPTP